MEVSSERGVMQKILLFLLVLLLPTQAFAADGNYIKGTIGIFMMEDSTLNLEGVGADADIGNATSDTGVGLGAAVGKSIGKIDIELEYAYREADFDRFEFDDEISGLVDYSEGLDGGIEIKTLMANGFYNFNKESTYSPYVGAGLGIAWVDVKYEGFDIDIDGTEFAYQFMAGVDVAMSTNTSLLIGYRYLGTSDISDSFEDVAEVSASIDSHNIEFGLKYSF